MTEVLPRRDLAAGIKLHQELTKAHRVEAYDRPGVVVFRNLQSCWPRGAWLILPGSMGRILIVDDEPDARAMLGRCLSMAGYEVVFAANGWEALLTLDSGHLDLVVLDLLMPGMNGETFLRILRQNGRHEHVPVVVVTAVDRPEACKRVKNLGVHTALLKSAKLLTELMDVVRELLGNGTGHEEPQLGNPPPAT